MLRANLINWIVPVLMALPLITHAAEDSINIGISVEIKPSLQCDYNYFIENSSNLNKSVIQFSTCDIDTSKLHQHLNQVAYSNLQKNTIQLDEDKYRVSMTVQ